LFATGFLPGVAIYDVVFCRNVLIYFDRATQDRALVVLNRLLNADGVLFVAPAETGLPASHGLVSTHEPLVFAFRKASALPPARKRKAVQVPAPMAPRSGSKTGPQRDAAHPAFATPAIARFVSPPTARSTASTSDLKEATRLADQGHFVEAATRCEEHLSRSGPSATAFYLMGLVRDATGNHSEAATYYRKALYLEPNHYDAQIHLALLIEKQGDLAGAQVLRNRSRRLEQKRKASHE
jgi:chemotaxis protein methyltransferase WspC